MPKTSLVQTFSTAQKSTLSRERSTALIGTTPHLIKGDVVSEISRIKGLDGPELQVHGSSNLIQTLLKHNLVDELQLWIFPVAIGTGKRLFGENINPSNFKFLDSKISTTGVIITRYEQGGELKTGTFELDNTQA